MEPSPFNLLFDDAGKDEDQGLIASVQLGNTHNTSVSAIQRNGRIDQCQRERTPVLFELRAGKAQLHADGIAPLLLYVSRLEI